jgi:hypothetical protein
MQRMIVHLVAAFSQTYSLLKIHRRQPDNRTRMSINMSTAFEGFYLLTARKTSQ